MMPGFMRMVSKAWSEPANQPCHVLHHKMRKTGMNYHLVALFPLFVVRFNMIFILFSVFILKFMSNS